MQHKPNNQNENQNHLNLADGGARASESATQVDGGACASDGIAQRDSAAQVDGGACASDGIATHTATPTATPTAARSAHTAAAKLPLFGFAPKVFYPAISAIVLLSAAALIAPDATSAWLQRAKAAAFGHFSWFYVLSVSAFVGFMLALSLSRYGDIRLGREGEEPALPFASWLAMLFATGMGVGLMYFGVAEPLVHKNALATNDSSAILHTVFHWGIHPWAIYGVTALAMAYFGFRHDMPLSLRSAFYPLLGSRIYGFWGHCVDVLALIVTVFGISTTLGYAAGQLAAGLVHLGWMQQGSFAAQAVIIVIIVSCASLSAASGANRGLRRLSEINIALALILLFAVMFLSDPVALLSQFSANIGNYLHELVALSFDTFAYESAHAQWFSDWTIFYWAWWLSWAPFVGFFIAKISRGRSVREFIFGVLVVPTGFNILWFSIFGGAALMADSAHFGALSALVNSPEKLLFEFLGFLPAAKLLGIFALLILTLFFITSADSGIFVLNALASRNSRSHSAQSILWGAVLALLAACLLAAGGLDAILSVTMLVALPFAAMLVIMCISLLRAFFADESYFSARVSPASVYLSGDHWQERVDALLRQSAKRDIEEFLRTRVLSAMEQFSAKLRSAGFSAYVRDVKGARRYVKLVVQKANSKDFIYGIEAVLLSTPKQLANDENVPFTEAKYYEPRTFFGDGRVGYDVSYLSEREIIADILKHYERYLHLIASSKTDLVTNALDS